jgi:lipopolysaccharide export system protein LptC
MSVALPQRVARHFSCYSAFVRLLRVGCLAGAALIALFVLFFALYNGRNLQRSSALDSDQRSVVANEIVRPRLFGLDEQNRPFIVTAATAETSPSVAGVAQNITLQNIDAGFRLDTANPISLQASSGVFDAVRGQIDLQGRIAVDDGKGTILHGSTAVVDVNNKSAQSLTPVKARNKSQQINAGGVQIFDSGNRVVFTGKTSVRSLREGDAP